MKKFPINAKLEEYGLTLEQTPDSDNDLVVSPLGMSERLTRKYRGHRRRVTSIFVVPFTLARLQLVPLPASADLKKKKLGWSWKTYENFPYQVSDILARYAGFLNHFHVKSAFEAYEKRSD